MTALVSACGVGVRFIFDRQRRPTSRAAAAIRRGTVTEWGIRGVDLTVSPGESVALVGGNGAGKTTLLRMTAGVYAADEGSITVDGPVASLLSVNAGMIPALTGRENCLLLGVIAGLSRERARAGLDELKETSQLGEAFERQVSSYSQGMLARLGLSVMERVHPRLLLLDEVHQALDHEFRGELESRARSTIAAGGAVMAAGHDLEALARICERALLLEHGRLRRVGPFDEVVEDYLGT